MVCWDPLIDLNYEIGIGVKAAVAFDTLVEVLKSLILGINLVALVALNLAFPLMWSLKFQEVPVLYVLLA